MESCAVLLSQLVGPILGPPSFATDDPDEADARQAAFGFSRRQPLGRGGLGLRAWRVLLGPLGVSWSTTATAQRLRATSKVPIVHLAIGGPLSYRAGHRHFEMMPGEVAFLPAGTDYAVGHGAGVTTLGFIPDQEQLEAELAARRPARRTLSPASAGIVGAAGSVPVLASILAGLRELPETDPSGSAYRHHQANITSWLADVLGGRAEGASATAMARSRMRRVEEWIDAHLFEPITLGRLCDAAGLEVSALHKAFKRHHSVSPMRWVHSRRMVAARLRLMEAGPKDTVIRIAHDCGLVHAGRFSLAYRRRYGEYPSYTLELAIKSG